MKDEGGWADGGEREHCRPGGRNDGRTVLRIWTVLLRISPLRILLHLKGPTSEAYPFMPYTYPVWRRLFYSVSQGI